MKYSVLIAAALFASFHVQVTVASEDCNYNWILANTDGSKATPDQYAEKERREKECKRNQAETKQRGAAARKRLKGEFGIDASGLSDSEAIVQLNAEVNQKKNDASAAAEAKANAAEKRRQDQNDALLKKQDEMLKEMGVKPNALAAGVADDSDEPDPAELQQYQKMLDSGIAPHCKGKKGWAMIDCVDQAME